LSQQSRRFFNATFDYNQLTVTSSTSAASKHQNDLGVIVSMDFPSNVYGGKSDRGTTDGYLALPLTTKSTEFFIAAWPSVPYFHVRQASVYSMGAILSGKGAANCRV